MPSSVINPPTNHSLSPYTGAWTNAQAAHLLRRSLFGPSFQQINQVTSDGLDAAIAQLMIIPAIGQPLTYDPAETIATFGQPWQNSPYPTDVEAAQECDTARAKSLGAWLMQRINNEGMSIAEKMCFFWHNHFAAILSFDQRSSYNYFDLIRQHALGNFKTLIKEMTNNTNMLEFLNGATNTFYSPNENYAREFLELYTIGKGIQIGPGDYSNYTEEDVAAGAKIFTGYTVEGLRSSTHTSVNTIYVPLYHDNSTKQLSYHFNSEVIASAGPVEYSNYIDVVFQQNEVAYFISRKLYRFFVNHELTEEVEQNIIPAMAAIMIASDYEIQPVVEALLKSQHFYDANLIGSAIRSPLEMLFSMFNCTGTTINFDLATTSDMYISLYYLGDTMGQGYGTPPSVSGWPAYYQAPNFTKLWVNGTHLKNRTWLAYYFTLATGLDVNGEILKIQTIPFLNGLSNPANANNVIDDIIRVFLPKPISAAQRQILKFILLGGQPDFEWTIQYNEYLAAPTDPTYYLPIQQKVELTLFQLFQMPEYHTV
ncbi:MAG: DUF1800 family protein [Crocinitomicaceae bacterium]|nr:DUF1800 family protein [Crocinitomicaceae bacterium]NGF77388.1 DUF1800 domain-containing protein [Fluviicola sp. SGL-29]